MSTEFCGTYVLILHSHIPYVLHHDRLNEEWLYEATAETYIPLLNVLYRLVREGVSPQITINISPVLAEQLSSPYFVKGFQNYCDWKIRFTQEDRKTFAGHDPHMLRLATLWHKFYYKTLRLFQDTYQGNIVQAFRHLQDEGHIEIITCGATHGYLPALGEDASINAQVRMARASYERLFGQSPRGFWLPECGYRPACHWVYPLTHRRHQPARFRQGVEEFLGENGISYFIIDQEQLKKSPSSQVAKIPWSTYCLHNNSGMHTPMTLFVRDTGLSEQIWNFEIGYPGDRDYLEFHKKQGGSGNRYWRITDKKLDLAYKEIYFPEAARDLVMRQAGHYKWSIKKTLKSQFLRTAQAGLKVSAFDAELFGHWWFEGPAWLYQLLKWIHRDPEMNILTCSAYQAKYAASQSLELPESSWGRDANSSTWINPAIEWVWERIYSAEKDMRDLANRFQGEKDPLVQRILRQCIRELLILQSSDWEFMITTNSTKDHGERRVVEHHEDFKRLVHLALVWEQNRTIDAESMAFLQECEDRENIFADPDPGWYR